MAVDRIFYCDAPDCEGHVQTASLRPRGGFLFVTDSSGGRTRHFCSWDCVMRYAATKEPTEIIPLRMPNEEDE
jgi:hypothetical protein